MGDLLLKPREIHYYTNFLPDHVDGIIVLGGGASPEPSAEWNQVQLNDGADRLTHALALA